MTTERLAVVYPTHSGLTAPQCNVLAQRYTESGCGRSPVISPYCQGSLKVLLVLACGELSRKCAFMIVIHFQKEKPMIIGNEYNVNPLL